MVVITADDYGKTQHATDCIIKCFLNKRITSASMMVFMADSERAASLATNKDWELGLHLNFTEPFTPGSISSDLHRHHDRVVEYLKKNKFSQIIYNPFLRNSFRMLFEAQYKEFVRLYGKQPPFINGHHHMHLCSNILASKLIPQGTKIRGTFTFGVGEKGLFNIIYRRILERIISKRYITPSSFYSIAPVSNLDRLQGLFKKAGKENVEIEVHPENTEELEFLLSDRYKALLDSAQVGSFKELE